RDWRRRENKRSRAVDQVINQAAGATNKTSGSPECFAERAHLNLDSAGHAQFLGQAATIDAIQPRRMSLIHHQRGAVPFLKSYDFPGGGLITVQPKNPVASNKHASETFGRRNRL